MNDRNAQQAEATAGVDQLIRRVRDEGVEQAREESRRLLEEARAEATAIVEEARAEADAAWKSAQKEIETHRTSAHEALKMAARDAVLALTEGVARAFEEHVKRLVTSITTDEELTRTMILLLAGRTGEQITADKDLEIMLSRALFDQDVDEKLRDRSKQQILSISREMLREGVELIPSDDIQGGATVRLVGENLEIDLTDRAISDLMLRYMQPRFISILKGEE